MGSNGPVVQFLRGRIARLTARLHGTSWHNLPNLLTNLQGLAAQSNGESSVAAAL